MCSGTANGVVWAADTYRAADVNGANEAND